MKITPYIKTKLTIEIAGFGGSKKKEDMGNKIRNNKTIMVIILVVSSILAVTNSFMLINLSKRNFTLNIELSKTKKRFKLNKPLYNI